MKAIGSDAVIAESDDTVIVEPVSTPELHTRA